MTEAFSLKVLHKCVDVYTLYAIFIISTVLLARISWLLALGLFIIAIPIYSYMWCIAQDFTEKDWSSEIAYNTSFKMVWCLLLGDIIAVIFLLIATPYIKTTSVNIITALCIIMVFAFIVGIRLHCTKHMLFLGAYMNYKQRIAGELPNQKSKP